MKSIQLKVPVIAGLVVCLLTGLFAVMKVTSDSSSRDEKPLFILTGPRRGGAGFVGEFFNHHSDVFYSYEPASIIREPCDTFENRELRSILLHNYLNCRIPDFRQEYGPGGPMSSMIEKNYIFRSKLRKLCQEPYCPGKEVSAKWDIGRCRAECPEVETEKIRRDCRKSVTVIKASNICSFKMLLPVLQQNPTNQVFYVVRDPRAIFNSIKNIGTMRLDDDLLDQIQEMCQEVSSVLYQIESLPRHVTERIQIIRFEDIWERPNQFSQIIQELSKIKQNSILDQYLYDQFSRNQRQLDEWRWLLNWSSIELIQKHCAPIMQPLGYLPLEKPESIKTNKITRSSCPNCRLEF